MSRSEGSYSKLIGIIVLFGIPLFGLMGLAISRSVITPTDLFFTGPTIDSIPVINSDDWNLTVKGEVFTDLEYTYDELRALPSHEIVATLACVEGPTGTALWKGVLVRDLLDLAGLKSGAVDVVFIADDGFTSSLTIDQVNERDIMLAYDMNNEALRREHGFPLRVVAPDIWGYKWVKWIVRVEVVDHDYIGFWESRGWDDVAERSQFSDWIIHALLLSISFLFGGLAMVSGLKYAPFTESFRDLPTNRAFHKTSAVIYLSSSATSFIYWLVVTFLTRGAIFYTIHGILALGSIFLIIPGILTGFQKTRKRDRFKRSWHYRWNLIAFYFFIFTILLGFLMAFTSIGQLY